MWTITLSDETKLRIEKQAMRALEEPTYRLVRVTDQHERTLIINPDHAVKAMRSG